jgi:hypothetical protein
MQVHDGSTTAAHVYSKPSKPAGSTAQLLATFLRSATLHLFVVCSTRATLPSASALGTRRPAGHQSGWLQHGVVKSVGADQLPAAQQNLTEDTAEVPVVVAVWARSWCTHTVPMPMMASVSVLQPVACATTTQSISLIQPLYYSVTMPTWNGM